MLVEIQVLPTPLGTSDDRYRYVDAAIARIAASGERHDVGALGTTIEGDTNALWALVRAAHDATLAAGATQVVTVIKIAQGADDASGLTIDALTARHRSGE